MNKKMLLPLLLVIFSGGLYLFLDFVSIGPGLPPPAYMFPDSWRPVEKGSHPEFPEISPQCNYRNYSGGRFVVAWYFDDRAAFLKGERTLYRFLRREGRLFVEEFDLREEVEEYGRVENPPVFFNATGYEGKNISGYFLVYERPFFEGRDDYFIVFYGNSLSSPLEGELSEQTPALKELMAKSFWHRGEGIRGLAPSRTSVNFPVRNGPFFPDNLPDLCSGVFAGLLRSESLAGLSGDFFSGFLRCIA